MASSRVLVVGAGGREHALAWRLALDPGPREVLVAPGNDGIGRRFRCLPLDPLDPPAIVDACRRERIDLVVIGPEAPLAGGLADALRDAGIAACGPGREAARIESSKWFAKRLMGEAGVPTARAESFEQLAAARDGLERFAPPFVIKADGLAAGKGVLITAERAAAEDFLAACLSGERFGPGGRRVVIEEHLSGEEVSLMAVADGRRFVLLPAARDYKRAHDHDRGGNTGGMGAYAPVELAAPGLAAEVGRRVVAPILSALAARGAPFRGVLYCGLMVAGADFRVLEFNVRFGDPEAQVVLPLLAGDLGRLLASAARGTLEADAIAPGGGAAVTVALVDEGYPEQARGGTIEGLDALEEGEGTMVFHGAARRQGDGWRVQGGRAAYVTARGASREQARRRVYEAVGSLSGSGWRCRADIGGDRELVPGPAGSGEAPGGA